MSAEPRHDLETGDDVEALVRAFYSRALTDPVIGYLFTDVAHLDLEAHVPQITSFWSTILLGAQSYGGGAFRPHAALHLKSPLREGHFERWLVLWRGAVDARFAGPTAELAKAHATRVARAFHGRVVAMDAARAAAADAPGGVVVTTHGPR